jgi:hypothetical protein
VQQQPGYGGGYGGGAPAAGASFQVMTIDAGCGGTVEHAKISDLANQMGAQGFVLSHVFMDVRSAFGPFCPKRCAVLVFKRG